MYLKHSAVKAQLNSKKRTYGKQFLYFKRHLAIAVAQVGNPWERHT